MACCCRGREERGGIFEEEVSRTVEKGRRGYLCLLSPGCWCRHSLTWRRDNCLAEGGGGGVTHSFTRSACRPPNLQSLCFLFLGEKGTHHAPASHEAFEDGSVPFLLGDEPDRRAHHEQMVSSFAKRRGLPPAASSG